LFDASDPAPSLRRDGEVLLEFTTCNAGLLSYDIPSIERSGEVAIERITLDNVPPCYLLGTQAGLNAAQP
jgi:hypothetical protein